MAAPASPFSPPPASGRLFDQLVERRRWSDTACAKTMRENGATFTEIARALRVSESTARNYCTAP